MYRRINRNQMAFEDFYLPFGGKLRSDNRWVILSKQIPWEEVEQEYIKDFSEEDMGSPAKSSRIAFGALILKERLRVTDRELTEQIAEGPYLQYFLGLSEYQEEAPFHDSMLTHFRKRFSQKALSKINEAIAHRVLGEGEKEGEDSKDDVGEDPPTPKGKLMVDATCTPADIKYPTDLNLLNEAREKTEEIIDRLHHIRSSPEKKPRTYRQKARQAYLRVSKAKKPGSAKMRKGIGKQLGYLRRNLAAISRMAKEGLLIQLKKHQYRDLLVIHELYRQQEWMYKSRSHRTSDRIVSISQPHVRPIVRGKAGAKVEFGAKVSLSLVEGVSFVDRISWDAYNESLDFSEEDMGSPAKSSRIAFGALILKERLRVTDRELTEQIAEGPYLQYFLGLSEYQEEAPFHDSMLTHFRKRFSQKALSKINEAIAHRVLGEGEKEGEDSKDDVGEDPPTPKGKLMVDATCTPADIKYPTDLNLLNEAREKTEEIIDRLHHIRSSPEKKPRTYRQKARQAYLRVSKAKKPGSAKMRKGIGKQLGYLRRNLAAISRMAKEGLLIQLKKHQYRDLLVIHELYRQQEWMYKSRSHRTSDRIVSISQPHVRPIVRGKAGAKVEFGAKVSLSLVEGVSFVDRISWDAYNESLDLEGQIEGYRSRFGHYPASVHADKIYRTRDNRRTCKSHGIRLSGPALGRPKKETEQNAEQLKQEKRLHRRDEIDRIAIEGKFGQGKRRFGLSRIMAKLAVTSEVMASFA